MGCSGSKEGKVASQALQAAGRQVGPYKQSKPRAGYAEEAKKVIQGKVRMFSGCMDEQTSADVHDVSSFGLPPVDGASSAGGACTNALLSNFKAHDNVTYGDLLCKMQGTLRQKGYKQVPQLSSSDQVDLRKEPFELIQRNGNRRTKSLLIGINYVGQKGELKGCVNDVSMMREFIISEGFATGDRMRVLVDEGPSDGEPDARGIHEAMKWLLDDCQSGDSLFFHYSGHGGQMKDDDGDEADGYDETLIPKDYKSAGQIRDDVIFKMLVGRLPAGAQLVCVFDCCHSGTILDLPFTFVGDKQNCQAIQQGGSAPVNMFANGKFNMSQAGKLAQQAMSGKLDFNDISMTLAKMAIAQKMGGGMGGMGGMGKLASMAGGGGLPF